MADDGFTTLTIHGLDVDNKLVRAEVFSQKLRAFLAGLAAADKLANGKTLHRFMIEKIWGGSVVARVREKQRTLEVPQRSGVAEYKRAVRAIYDGDQSIERLPRRLVASVKTLSVGVNKEFSHAEVAFEASNVIRIDDFLLRQSEAALQVAGVPATEKPLVPLYKGLAKGSFDGVLRLMDSRGEVLRAKLVTTAGNVEIDCVVNKARTPEFIQHFDRRVRIEGVAHYDGQQQLPLRVDVHEIRQIKGEADFLRWRGAFNAQPDPDVEM